jgi:hypothetical protein
VDIRTPLRSKAISQINLQRQAVAFSEMLLLLPTAVKSTHL